MSAGGRHEKGGSARCVVIDRPGGYGRLQLQSRPVRPPAAGEVSVRAEACGVNYADCLVRMGLYSSAQHYVGWPITPGFEVAGWVRAVGAGVEDVRVGDPVIAVTRFGGYAEEVTIPRTQLFERPRGLDGAQAAAFPTVHLTAWYALMELAQVRPGQKVLVHSAAGGVGSALVQLARVAGAHPIAVVGAPHKVAVARELGAEAVIDKSRQALWSSAEALAPRGYDIVLDANGVETLKESYAHLIAGGRLVIYGFHTMLPRGGRGRPSWPKLARDWLRTPRFDPLEMTGSNRSVLAFNLSYMFEHEALLREAMTQLLAWLDEGKLRAPEVTRYSLEAVAEAHRALESGQTTGKLVLTT